MPEQFPIGFTQEFDTTGEAVAFLQKHQRDVGDDKIMVIPGHNVRSVRVRSMREAELKKRDRSHENNSTITGGDDLKAGVNGIINHADGKRYDSKSEFRKATRRAGCYEVGNDIKSRDVEWKTPLARGVQGDFNVRPALKEALHKHGVK